MAKKLSLDQFAGGALAEKVNQSFSQVMKNMQDPNTSFKDKRKITIELTFDQTEERDKCNCVVSVKTKLATVLPTQTQFFTGKDLKTGDVEFEEYGNRDTMRGQMEMTDEGLHEAGEGAGVTNIRNLRKTANQ